MAHRVKLCAIIDIYKLANLNSISSCISYHLKNINT